MVARRRLHRARNPLRIVLHFLRTLTVSTERPSARRGALANPKILIADPLNERGASILSDSGLQIDTKPGLNEDDLCKIIGEYDGLIVRSATTVTPKVIAAARNCRSSVGRRRRASTTSISKPPRRLASSFRIRRWETSPRPPNTPSHCSSRRSATFHAPTRK